MTNYQLLINRLDGFIRKYYANKLLRGTIIFLGSALAFYLIISLGEYYFYFPSWLRYTLLAILGTLGLGSLISLVLIPLLKMQKLGKVISREQAAEIIGSHFPNVKDKLLNILQLNLLQENAKSQALISASIEQKTKELSPVPFSSAINLSKNKKYLPYLLVPILAGIVILFTNAKIFTDSAERLFQPDKAFVPAAPFAFELKNKKLSIPQYEDIEIKVAVNGTTLPENVNINIGGQEIAMIKKNNNIYSYTLHKLSKNTTFSFEGNGFESKQYEVKVMANPSIQGFKVSLNYPSYTGKKDEVLKNIGDVVVPQGTSIRWTFTAQHTSKILFGFSKFPNQPMARNGNRFSIAKTFYRDTTYSIQLSNSNVKAKDILQYQVSVIPDQSPSINVNQYNDSLTGDFVLFTGEAGDDYGIRSVAMHYNIKSKAAARSGRVPMKITSGTFTQFDYLLDVQTLNLQAGDKLQYYFLACDNDAVNGSKCAKSSVFTFNKPSEAQADSLLKQAQKEINKDLKDASKENQKVDKEIKEIKEKLLNKKSLDWQDKKQLQQLVNKNQSIQKQIEKIQQKFQKSQQKNQEKNHSDEIKEKQQAVDKMLEELKDNKLAERMKKIEELMKMLNKDKLFEELQKTEDENLQMEKDLDRMLELMKQLERDMRMEDLAQKAQKLADKQEKLNEETKLGKDKNELKKKQDELKKETEELKKDLDELEKLNKETETPQDLKGVKKDQENAKSEMSKSSESLSKGNKSKSSKSQKKAQESLQKMANALNAMAAGGSQDQTEVDIKATRQILSNLLRMSFGQEELIDKVRKTKRTDPAFVTNVREQYKLKDDSKMISDSLFALSKRLFEISSFVNKETAEINTHMTNSITALEARNSRSTTVSQQYVMTHTNNLALMLNELLDNLQKKQAKQQSQAGQAGSCKKPGSKPGKKPGKKPGQGVGMQLGDIITKQKQLGSAMKQLMDKKGKKPGEGKGKGEGKKPGEGNKPGKGGKPGQSGDGGQAGQGGQPSESEQMARMAAQQAALRKQLNDIHSELIKNGKSNPELTKIRSEMDRVETELVNKRITDQLLSRQAQILTRLMKAKDAMREQDQGEERESKSGKAITREIPQELKDILKDKQSAIEYYKTVPAALKPYYKDLVEKYFGLIK